MKCYNHIDTDAVGICKNCGRAVCKSCSSIYGEKLLCSSCLINLESKLKEEKILSSDRMQEVIKKFDYYLDISKRAIGLNSSWREGVIEHIKVINTIRNAKDYSLLAQDDSFIRSIYNTLILWGMNRRGAKMKSYDDFKVSIFSNLDLIKQLEKYELEELSDKELFKIHDILISLFLSLDVMETKSKLIGVSKALAHILPDLVPPMDRENVYYFVFGHKNLPLGYKAEAKKFWEILEKFHYIQKETHISKKNHKFEGFNTSVPKMIDNAIWGFIYEEKNKARSLIEHISNNCLKQKITTKAPIWELVGDAVSNFSLEFSNKDIKNFINNKYGNVNTNTVQCMIYMLTVNNPARINWGFNQKERIADSKYDLLYKNKNNKLERYDTKKHGLWEIIKVGGKFKINLKKEENKIYFSSYDDAVSKGYRPCKICKPTK